MSQRFSAADVASQSKAGKLYIIVDEDVYDVTKFQDEHPGELCPLTSYDPERTHTNRKAGGKKSECTPTSQHVLPYV
jgi:cytochrome b involved in lipid metabolism